MLLNLIWLVKLVRIYYPITTCRYFAYIYTFFPRQWVTISIKLKNAYLLVLVLANFCLEKANCDACDITNSSLQRNYLRRKRINVGKASVGHCSFPWLLSLDLQSISQFSLCAFALKTFALVSSFQLRISNRAWVFVFTTRNENIQPDAILLMMELQRLTEVLQTFILFPSQFISLQTGAGHIKTSWFA